MTDDSAIQILEELRAQKKLMILHLLALGYSQRQVASALDVSDATVSRMLPKGIGRVAPDYSTLLKTDR